MGPDLNHKLVSSFDSIVDKVSITKADDQEVLVINILLACLAGAVGSLERAGRFISICNPLKLLVPHFERAVLRRSQEFVLIKFDDRSNVALVRPVTLEFAFTHNHVFVDFG
jgi:hypothetical protein